MMIGGKSAVSPGQGFPTCGDRAGSYDWHPPPKQPAHGVYRRRFAQQVPVTTLLRLSNSHRDCNGGRDQEAHPDLCRAIPELGISHRRNETRGRPCRHYRYHRR